MLLNSSMQQVLINIAAYNYIAGYCFQNVHTTCFWVELNFWVEFFLLIALANSLNPSPHEFLLCVSDQTKWFMAQMGVASPCRPGFAQWCNRLNDSCQSNEVSIHSGLCFDRHVIMKVFDVSSSSVSLSDPVCLSVRHTSYPQTESHECQSHTSASQTFISD